MGDERRFLRVLLQIPGLLLGGLDLLLWLRFLPIARPARRRLLLDGLTSWYRLWGFEGVGLWFGKMVGVPGGL